MWLIVFGVSFLNEEKYGKTAVFPGAYGGVGNTTQAATAGLGLR